MAYGLLYLFLNLGYFAAGFAVDLFRDLFPLQYSEMKNGKEVEFDKPLNDVPIWDQMTAYRWIQIFSAIMTAAFLCIAFIFVHDVEVVLRMPRRDNERDNLLEKEGNILSFSTRRSMVDIENNVITIRGKDIRTEDDLASLGSDGLWLMTPFTNKPREGFFAIVKCLGTDRVFWLVSLLCFTILGVRMLFRHLDATFPQYMEREMGDETKLGAVFSMNPLAVVIFLLFLAPLFSTADVMQTMIVGMGITACAPLWLLIGAEYWTGILFMITMALGESVWMPKFMDLTISRACPDGEEGIFTALVNAPTFFAKFLAGIVSGYMLDHFCPEEGKRDSKTMWLLISIISLSSPIIVLLLQLFGLWDSLKAGMRSSNSKAAKARDD